MKRTSIRLLSAMLLLCFLSAFPLGVVASEIDESSASPQYISSCPEGGKHMMTGKGSGSLYLVQGSKKTLVLANNPVTQCTKCYLVLITENTPLRAGLPWGIYATKTWDEPIASTTYKTYIETEAYSVCDDLNDPYVQGFEFVINRSLLNQ